ncbi:MAG TPA: BamA/TamA family outer membrane protein [Candidatus Eisenbacteria bacterium]
MGGATRIGGGALLALAALLAWGAAPAPASPSVGRSGAPDGAFAARFDGVPDSLRASLALAPEDSARLWSSADLSALAQRLRDDLAARGLVDRAVRLVLVPGRGTSPGVATLSVAGPAAGPAAAVPRVVPVLAIAGDGEGIGATDLPVLAAAFTRGSRGSTTTDAVAAGVSAVRDALIERGRYAAEVGVDSIAADSGAIRIHLRVVPGARTTVASLELAGAATTRPSAAAALSGLKPGAAVTPASLAEARDRLVQSGLFATVGDARLVLGDAPGRARVVIPVEESRASRFEGAIGVAREGGVTGRLDLALGNIGGTGRSAGIRWFGPGGGRDDYAVTYREPALFGRALDAGLSLEAQVADSLYTHTRWSLEAGARPARAVRTSLAIVRSGSVYSGLARGSSATWSLSARATVDGLTPTLNPVRGASFAVGAEAGRRVDRFPGFAASARRLFRGDLSLQAARPLGVRRVLYASARAQETILPGDAFPAEELLYLGGSEGLRGHDDRAFGGNRIASFTLEHRWITDDRGGRLYLFGDAARHDLDATLQAGTASILPTSAGAAASLARTVLSRGWEFGYGAGLRTRMAAGLVGLELGFAPGEPFRRATLHVRYASTW